MIPAAYDEGRVRAEEDFGLRTAAYGFRRPMPRNDVDTAAERLADRLGQLEDEAVKPKDERRGSRLERQVRWGQPGSPYGSSTSSFDYSGIGQDGAAI